jgi:monovalent cation/proton antiporter MnhG/PhaG subunit
MSVFVDALLALAVLVVLGSSVGILVMRDVYQKLHFVTPAALVAPVLVGIAILIHSGWSSQSGQTWIALLFVVIAGPVLSHATVRAARIRQAGDWRGCVAKTPGQAKAQGPAREQAGAQPRHGQERDKP